MDKPKVQLNISSPDKSKMLNLYTETVDEMQELRESVYIKAVEKEILGSPAKKPSTPVTASSEEAPNCPDCGKLMQKREGKFGPFWGCSGYPDCKKIVKVSEEKDLPFE